jgi:pimeloyl-ACP methyl ester carboxylesterase
MSPEAMSVKSPQNIVLIHGLWLTPLGWENWMARYSDKGYRVVAAAWPGIGNDIEAIRRDPTPVEQLGVGEIADHYEKLIRGLDHPPIIMGHSFGGLITQILLDRGLGSAGVAIASAPVKGIFVLPFSTLKSSFPGLKNPAGHHRATTLTPDQFHYAFANTVDEAESKKLYDRYAIPGPNHVLFQASLANFNPHAATAVDFHNHARASLLLIAGGKDHVSPVSVNKANFHLYKKSKAVTDYKEFPERPHFTMVGSGWEEVADYALDWATQHVRVAQRA